MDSLDVSFPVRITFHGAERWPALEEAVRARVAHLPRFHPRIHGVEVTLTKEAGHHVRGNRYRVQVRVAVPGDDVVVARQHPERAEHEDAFLTVNDAFRAVERRLEDDVRLRRGDVKARAATLQPGRVVRLAGTKDHGFLETLDGREVYFHRNSVLDGEFDDLEVGSAVRFAEEEGRDGPQASTVHALG